MFGARYRLDARLGGGGAGVVYRGWDQVLDEPVAIKVFRPDGIYAAEEARAVQADLRAEARASMRLAHPNVARVHTYDSDGKWEFLVMEFVDGLDLGRLRASRPGKRLELPQVLRIGVAAADALDHAHKLGILHNDVKPANLLVDRAGVPKVCDFGLALLRARDGASRVTGSPLYMAPERIRGGAGSAESDQYSLGATLFALAAGTPPFGTDRRRAVRGHLISAVPVSKYVPLALDRILRRAMAKQPADRYPSLAAMRDDLLRIDPSAPREVDGPDAPTVSAVTRPADPALLPAPATPPIAPPPPAEPAPKAQARPNPAPEGPRLARNEARQRTPDRESPAPPTQRPAPAPVRPDPARWKGMARIASRAVSIGERTVVVAAFHVELVPVTNSAYQAFVRATHARPPSHWLGDRFPTGRDDHPVVGVTIDDARAYAKWAGRRLVSEAEWIAVLRGPDGRPYPWGERCDARTCQCPRAGSADTSSVRAHPTSATPEGVLDLLGNVWEWVEADPRLRAPASDHAILLGGSFRHACPSAGLPRSEVDAHKAFPYAGFRCAADDPGAESA